MRITRPKVAETFTVFSSQAADILRRGGVGVLPTDTIYGIVGSALKSRTVERIYALRERTPGKPMIVLLAGAMELQRFGIVPNPAALKLIRTAWPGPVSIILPCPAKRLTYLHRGAGTLAFRVPALPALRRFLKKTGPLVAPSANPEGEVPAKNAAAARRYFGDGADFYIEQGVKHGRPSALLRLREDGQIEVLRRGAKMPPLPRS